MSFDRLNYGRSWNNKADFPTYVEGEEEVRANFQYHPDAIKMFINAFLNALESASGAGSIGTEQGDLQTILNNLRIDIETVAAGGTPSVSQGVPVLFETEDWTAPVAEDGYYTLAIDRTVHKRMGAGFGYNLWQSVEGEMISNTWGVAGTQVSIADNDGNITLKSRTPYTGVIVFFG